MRGNYPFTDIPQDVRGLVDGEGRRLEAIEYIIGAPTFAVITYRVDYRAPPTFGTPPGVIKLSKKEHAIPDSSLIKLGSSRHYREGEVSTTGVADPEEARLVQRGSLREFRKKNGLSSEPWHDNVSSTVTWARRDFLMFCTSLAPQYGGFGTLKGQFPDYDSATLIADPSAFAMQLGKDIGKQFDMENVRLDSFDALRRMQLSEVTISAEGHLLHKGVDTVVYVSHGPVAYCDPPEEVINRYPIARRAEVVPFVKRSKFAGQREYRFVIEVIGEPEEAEFLIEVTDELRSLTCPYPDFTKIGIAN